MASFLLQNSLLNQEERKLCKKQISCLIVSHFSMHLIVKFMLYSSSMIKGCPNFKKFWFQNITNFGRLRKFSCLLCLIIWGCQYSLMLTHILCDVRADFDIEHCFQLDLLFNRKPRWESKFPEKVCTIVLLFNMTFIAYWGSYHPVHAILI